MASTSTQTTHRKPPLNLNNKQILVGITGGIAAYKAAELVRLLQKSGAAVRVIMTRAATEFITPLTLQALSGKPVHLDLLDTAAEAAMGHIELARWADAIIIAPATADTLARLAQGRSDDLLGAVCSASSAALALAPAMNQQMWRSAATQQNTKKLREQGVHLFGPAEGEQACGDIGPGRMLEPEHITEKLAQLFQSRILQGKNITITAGPTREALDPIRYLSNRSSGKMGYALAEAAVEAGAKVTLISGPSQLAAPNRLDFVSVTSAQEMHQQAMTCAQNCDIFIAAAAVADYRPAQVSEQKIKKGSGDTLSLELIKNPDIVADVARQNPALFTIGFAAETQNMSQHAQKKLQRKNLQMIIANDVSNQAIGFDSEENAVTVFWPKGEKAFSAQRKSLLAKQLLEFIASHQP